jgi:hypothetical protein
MEMRSGKWPCISASIEFFGVVNRDDPKRQDKFKEEISQLFDRFQATFDGLANEEKAKCGLCGIAADVSLKIDLEKREVILDKLYKYCVISFHLFTELLQILKRNFSDYTLIVPSLQGFELAKEILRFLGMPEIEFIYLKGNGQERLLSGRSLPEGVFPDILDFTEKHYEGQGDVEMRNRPLDLALDLGLEVSMYYERGEGEEEVLWMYVTVPLSDKRRPNDLKE